MRRTPSLLVLIVALAACTDAVGQGPRATPSPTSQPDPSPTRPPGRVGGVAISPPVSELPPWEKPYPFTEPVPPEEPTTLDGTYLRVVSLDDAGGPKLGLPIRCFRCIPFRLDAGVSTLVLHEGAYYLHHHLSGFRTKGHYLLHGDRVELANDANCPQTRGTYRWSRSGRRITFAAIDDPCPFDKLRARDLEFGPWTLVNACVYRLQNLWPAALGCN